jgi:hypothetical protein
MPQPGFEPTLSVRHRMIEIARLVIALWTDDKLQRKTIPFEVPLKLYPN